MLGHGVSDVTVAPVSVKDMLLWLHGQVHKKLFGPLVASSMATAVWLPVEDDDVWVLATVKDKTDESVELERYWTPPSGVSKTMTMSPAEFDKLKLCTMDYTEGEAAKRRRATFPPAPRILPALSLASLIEVSLWCRAQSLRTSPHCKM